MNDPSKKVKNPLFNISVTGGTLEDFSQNAILLPAKEKPPLPNINLSPEQLLNDIISATKPTDEEKNPPSESIFSDFTNSTPQPTASSQHFSDIQPSPNVSFLQELPDISTLQPHLSTPHQASNFSSVFSSFSSILNIGGSNNTRKEEVSVPPPAGIDQLINQDNNNPAAPVPLFSTNTPELNQQKPPPTTGPTNVFRRSALKRPAYAQIPGLSNDPLPLQNIPQNLPPQNLPPLPVTSYQIPQNNFAPSAPSPVNSVSSTSSIEPVIQNLPNQFKPISPPPPSLQPAFQIPQPLIPVPVQPAAFQPLAPVGSYYSPVVMDAIPVNELTKSSRMTPTNSTESPPAVSDGRRVHATANQVYRPVYHHWFFQKEIEGKKLWHPFSMVDSLALENAFTSNDLDPEKVIATDGGRYDVNILRRQRNPVYWKGNPNEVRRCSWFHKSSPDGRPTPYEENISTMLEQEYKTAYETNSWRRTIELSQGESIIFHGPEVMVLSSPSQIPDSWGQSTNQLRHIVVKRGMDEFDIDEGEPSQVDHILFMVHGIGSVCDLKFRRIVEVVDEFRSIALQLVQSHYRSSCEQGKVNRIEVLPISWHDRLHSEETGIDEQLESITLKSLSTLREFTNHTLLDILFYTSPVYCQKIITTVGTELNRLYDIFKQRNPNFSGGVSLAGHSLGSLILFDLLCHQLPSLKPETEETEEVSSEPGSTKPAPMERKMSRRISYMMGAVGTGQPQINYTLLNFEPKNFFALGSPIATFVVVRGVDTLGEKFSLPTCPAFFNIFHPCDPIAYRIESLIKPEFGSVPPVLIPHHKGRKRIHLELKETMARVGADLKQKVVDSMRNTWNTVYQLAMFHKQTPPSLEEEVSNAFREQFEEKEEIKSNTLPESTGIPVGNLNGGRRVDYVLQEAPFEFINNYLSAITSHVCYWESEDTILLMLKEIYSSMGLISDNQIPQQTMTIERPVPSPVSFTISKPSVSPQNVGMDPTAPIHLNEPLRPPPTTGFVRKT